MLDLCELVRDAANIDITYAFFDTGIEYAATKRHLEYLEGRYGISIERMRPIKSIPTCVAEYGQPFLSKIISERMGRLQKWGFQWEDEPFDVLAERYPNCISSIRWWTNDYTRTPGVPGQYDIGYVHGLKEFIIANPPWFPISNKCCDYTKKKVAYGAMRDGGYDIDLIGVRKAEGGIRSKEKSCFTKSFKGGADRYRPIFWWKNEDRQEWERLFGIRHSDCYEVYGFKRTGCAGCPYNQRLEADMEVARRYEPMLHKAMCRVFSDAYEYTRMWKRFRTELKSGGQMSLDLTRD